MASKNVETVRNAHQAWNRRDFEGVIQNIAENHTYQDYPTGQTIRNREGFRTWTESWARAMSDGQITKAEYIDAGDVVITQFIAEGTNDGPFAGLPPTNRRISFPMCEISRFDKQGRMIGGGAYYDLHSILTQLGHVKPLAVAA
jgi:steroid delta-isomerase-like uncharacterized protein